MNTTAKKILTAKRFFEANPTGKITTGIWSDGTWTKSDFYKWFRKCLMTKCGVTELTERQRNLLRDCRIVRDYCDNRIRHTGCRNLLNTPAMKTKYPHINNQPNED